MHTAQAAAPLSRFRSASPLLWQSLLVAPVPRRATSTSRFSPRLKLQSCSARLPRASRRSVVGLAAAAECTCSCGLDWSRSDMTGHVRAACGAAQTDVRLSVISLAARRLRTYADGQHEGAFMSTRQLLLCSAIALLLAQPASGATHSVPGTFATIRRHDHRWWCCRCSAGSGSYDCDHAAIGSGSGVYGDHGGTPIRSYCQI